VRFINRETVEICGTMRAPTVAEWRAIRETLEAIGVKTAMFCRGKRQGKPDRLTVVLAGRGGVMHKEMEREP
jgi:hypothetical protein